MSCHGTSYEVKAQSHKEIQVKADIEAMNSVEEVRDAA